MRSLFFRIIGVLLSFLVAFAVAEVAVRLISPQEVGPVRFACNPELGEIPVPGQQGERQYPGVYYLPVQQQFPGVARPPGIPGGQADRLPGALSGRFFYLRDRRQ